jgi:hypothetical protein
MKTLTFLPKETLFTCTSFSRRNGLNEKTLRINSSFYLSVNHTMQRQEITLPETKWFKLQQMGVNKLNSLMKDCAERVEIGLGKRITIITVPERHW